MVHAAGREAERIPDAAAAAMPRAAHPLDALAGRAGRSLALVGAGGCGMRGLARLFLQAGWRVWGQDARGFDDDDALLREGMRPWPRAQAPEASWVVRSAAVPDDESHWIAACDGGARSASYAEMLGEISRVRPVIAVAGSHGKTTCAAWIAFGLRRAGIPAGYLVGAHVPQLGASADWGHAALPLVVESCEYARSFLHLRPAEAVLVNVDAEHPDTYPGGLPEVRAAFQRFLSGVAEEGCVHAGPEAPDLSAACPASWRAAPALDEGARVGPPGHHNRRNAALVAAVLRAHGVPPTGVAEALADFRGAARRLERVGTLDGAPVVSDYAHHPVEVAATLQAARERWPGRRLVAVFQPHQAQRFHAYRDQFAPALDLADRLLLLEIYRARDPAELRASVAELVPELQRRRPGRPLRVARAHAGGEAWLRDGLGRGDLVLCLGAGDVDAFARRLV